MTEAEAIEFVASLGEGAEAAVIRCVVPSDGRPLMWMRRARDHSRAAYGYSFVEMVVAFKTFLGMTEEQWMVHCEEMARVHKMVTP